MGCGCGQQQAQAEVKGALMWMRDQLPKTQKLCTRLMIGFTRDAEAAMLGYKVKTKYMQAAQVNELESFVTHLVKQPAYESQKRCQHLHKKKYSGRALKRNVKETREKVNLDSRVSLARGRENKVKAKGWATEREEKHAGWVEERQEKTLMWDTEKVSKQQARAALGKREKIAIRRKEKTTKTREMSFANAERKTKKKLANTKSEIKAKEIAATAAIEQAKRDQLVKESNAAKAHLAFVTSVNAKQEKKEKKLRKKMERSKKARKKAMEKIAKMNKPIKPKPKQSKTSGDDKKMKKMLKKERELREELKYKSADSEMKADLGVYTQKFKAMQRAVSKAG